MYSIYRIASCGIRSASVCQPRSPFLNHSLTRKYTNLTQTNSTFAKLSPKVIKYFFLISCLPVVITVVPLFSFTTDETTTESAKKPILIEQTTNTCTITGQTSKIDWILAARLQWNRFRCRHSRWTFCLFLFGLLCLYRIVGNYFQNWCKVMRRCNCGC